eukprot:1421655-Rhodomonas_salina.1
MAPLMLRWVISAVAVPPPLALRDEYHDTAGRMLIAGLLSVFKLHLCDEMIATGMLIAVRDCWDVRGLLGCEASLLSPPSASESSCPPRLRAPGRAALRRSASEVARP